MASATMKGNIEQYISTTNSETTKDLQEVLSQLEQPSNSGLPRTLLVEGSPGIGKSVLLKEISYLWARNESLTKSDFLFLLQLRDPAVQEMKSLECLVRHFYNQGKEAESHLLQDGGKSVTILLDGYDELPADLRQNSFIAHLLQHKVLPASAMVVSSRPHASTHLHDNVTCRVEILGFSEEDQTHFIQQSLEGQQKKISHLNKYLTTHPTIASLCFVPFNMTILMFLYKQQATLPTRSSDLYKLFICLTICRHLVKLGKSLENEVTDLNSIPQPYSDIIKEFSKFAFKALNKNKLVFSLAEIKEHCPAIVDHPNGFGLLQAVEYVGLMSRTHSFNFVHFSVQEFLAAHYIASVAVNEERSILEEYFWSDIHYNTFNFYVALTSGQSPSFKRFLRSGSDVTTIDDRFLKDKLQSLRLYRIFHEAGDISTCKTIEGNFTDKEIDLWATTLSPNNLEDLTTLLIYSSCRNWKELNLSNCYIQDYGLQLLHRSLHNTNITIDHLWLNNNDLSSSSDSSLSDIVITCKVKALYISGNKTVGETPQFFTTILTHPSYVIETLYMSHNNYTARPAMELLSSLRENKTVKQLRIDDNNISDDECGVICDVLRVNNTLRGLDMSDNPITGQASQLILDALKDNNTLEQLVLSHYPEDIKKEITSLEQVVNEKRRRRGCDVKLGIFYW
ncbi:protein NLRC3-like [Dysidea avara]|uniref:protein NLRC3-like n=1 Tax=Dysidea avara TaxID=196820 RepID=UPI00331BBD43